MISYSLMNGGSACNAYVIILSRLAANERTNERAIEISALSRLSWGVVGLYMQSMEVYYQMEA